MQCLPGSVRFSERPMCGQIHGVQKLVRRLHSHPRPWQGTGVSLKDRSQRPAPTTFAEVLAEITGIGPGPRDSLQTDPCHKPPRQPVAGHQWHRPQQGQPQGRHCPCPPLRSSPMERDSLVYLGLARHSSAQLSRQELSRVLTASPTARQPTGSVPPEPWRGGPGPSRTSLHLPMQAPLLCFPFGELQ